MKFRNICISFVSILMIISYTSCSNSFQETEQFRFSVIAKIGIEEAKTKEELPLQFARVRSIDCDREGNIYVLDDRDYCVKVFNKDGVFLRKMFSEGKGPQELSNPGQIKINKFSHHLFILQEHGFQLKEFNRQGKFIKVYSMPEQLSKYFEFIDNNRFIVVATGRYGEDKYNSLKIINLTKPRVEKEFAPTASKSMTNAYQRFVIKDGILWTCPGDKMTLVAYEISTGKEIASYSIKEEYKKPEMIRGQNWQAIKLSNYAIPVTINNIFFIWVVKQDFSGQTEDKTTEPKSQKVKIYRFTGEDLALCVELPDLGDIIQLETVWKHRILVTNPNGFYPKIIILEFK